MTLTNAYTTMEALAGELGIEDAQDESRLESSINASSRQVDAHCGRRFWQDATVVARSYHTDDAYCAVVDDISTTDGLIVKLDDGDDGTFSTTLTISTDFILAPLNAAAGNPVRPYNEILLVNGHSFPMSSTRRPGLQVTAKFGWPAVPDDVSQACLIQAKNLYKAASGTFVGYQLSLEAGVAVRTPRLDPFAIGLLEPYVRIEC